MHCRLPSPPMISSPRERTGGLVVLLATMALLGSAQGAKAQSADGLTPGLRPVATDARRIEVGSRLAIRSIDNRHHPIEGAVVGAAIGELAGFALSNHDGFNPIRPVPLSLALMGALIGFILGW